ncbi:MAG: hypothetical protein ACU0BO_10460 [Limimaricola soesokkakensis]|uniref:hypothetical protein n=1 Tax=Limimaricola soesokkakensis TaxID=1343159 RepID=UPI0040598BAF
MASDREPDTCRGGAGLALNGMELKGSASAEAILRAYTISAFDDCSAHINPVACRLQRKPVVAAPLAEADPDGAARRSTALPCQTVTNPFRSD